MAEQVSLAADQGRHLDGVRAVGPKHRVVAVFVGTQDRVRVVVLAGQQPVQVGRVRPQMWTGELIALGRLRHFSHSLRSRFSRWSAGIWGMFSMWATALAGSMRTKFDWPHWYSSPVISSRTQNRS